LRELDSTHTKLKPSLSVKGWRYAYSVGIGSEILWPRENGSGVEKTHERVVSEEIHVIVWIFMDERAGYWKLDDRDGDW
jgi:hypothetical protein